MAEGKWLIWDTNLYQDWCMYDGRSTPYKRVATVHAAWRDGKRCWRAAVHHGDNFGKEMYLDDEEEAKRYCEAVYRIAC